MNNYQELVAAVAELNKLLQANPKEPFPTVGWQECAERLLEAIGNPENKKLV